MAEELSTQPGNAVHFRVGGYLADMRGWGRSRPPRGRVQIQLRDPGEFAVVLVHRPLLRTLAVVPIANLGFTVDAKRRSKGGGYRGGGFGLRGMAKGLLLAKVMNAVTYRTWEETRVLAAEELPTGARRSLSITIPSDTPASLLERMAPAMHAWAEAWVTDTVKGRISPFEDTGGLADVYSWIDTIQSRRLIDDHQWRRLTDACTRPLVLELDDRLRAGTITADEAADLTHTLEHLASTHRLPQRHARPLLQRLQSIATPAPVEDRENTIARLTQLRQTGVITEFELQAEITRLRGR